MQSCILILLLTGSRIHESSLLEIDRLVVGKTCIRLGFDAGQELICKSKRWLGDRSKLNLVQVGPRCI